MVLQYLSGKWLSVPPRMDVRKACLEKNLHYVAK